MSAPEGVGQAPTAEELRAALQGPSRPVQQALPGAVRFCATCGEQEGSRWWTKHCWIRPEQESDRPNCEKETDRSA